MISDYVFTRTYARWDEEAGRRETYDEAVNRSIDWLKDAILSATGYKLTVAEDCLLSGAMFGRNAFPSMRLFQMAGPAAERCNLSIYNCAYRAIDEVSAFAEMLYVSMAGTGVGYSVERASVDKLPWIMKRRPEYTEKAYLPVSDSTEGWCNAYMRALRNWFDGVDVHLDTTGVRDAGSRLKTKGGRASGPGPFLELCDYTRSVIAKRWDYGGRLTPLECNDIACKIGETVVVGGVRRTAMISLSDLDAQEMRYAKSGPFWEHSPVRRMANNSAVYVEPPSLKAFRDEWTALKRSGTGERGIWNRYGYNLWKPTRRQRWDWGVNPCGEVALRSQGLCNLSIAIARSWDTRDSLRHKVMVAAIFGTLQSALTRFRWLPDAWRKNAEEERLLGVDITGQMDCPLLQPGAPGREKLLAELQALVIETNRVWASKLGIGESMASTCVKPSGNSSMLFDCSSGLHPRFAPYYIRRIRGSWDDPLTHLLLDQGVPASPEVGQDWNNVNTVVFDFPCSAPDGAITRRDMSALEQFDNWMVWKTCYTEHNPSVTIYVAPHEWDSLGAAVYRNFDKVGGLSFLPLDDHVYDLAPYEEIDAETFSRMSALMPSIDYSRLPQYEQSDHTTGSQELACTGDKCELM